MATVGTGAIYCSMAKADLCLVELYMCVPESSILFGHGIYENKAAFMTSVKDSGEGLIDRRTGGKVENLCRYKVRGIKHFLVLP